jgi:hypothetical protein
MGDPAQVIFAIMIGYQAVGVADPVTAADHARERAQKQLTEKYFLAGVAPARQMINRAGKF